MNIVRMRQPTFEQNGEIRQRRILAEQNLPRNLTSGKNK
jgi:hypothetical protein